MYPEPEGDIIMSENINPEKLNIEQLDDVSGGIVGHGQAPSSAGKQFICPTCRGKKDNSFTMISDDCYRITFKCDGCNGTFSLKYTNRTDLPLNIQDLYITKVKL